MDPGTLLRYRYRIERILGERRLASTAVALDEHTGRRCVVKRLSVTTAFSGPVHDVGTVSGSDAQKLVELFEREGRVLAHCDHPRIPRLIECFTETDRSDTLLYLVQEHVDAPSLAELIDAGRHFTESEVLRIGIDIADTLAYLHGRSPPLVHRDVKPSNVLFDDERGAFLIDFGAVKDRLAQHGLAGATIVGTFDYMPLEQYQGNAVPATDIYSLGLTLVAALSHQEPSDLGRRGTRVDFRPHVRTSSRLATILDRMIEPALEGRYDDARDVKRNLEDVLSGTPSQRSGRRTAAAIAAAVALAGWGIVSFTPYLKSAERWEGGPVVEGPRVAANDPVLPVVPANGLLRINVFEDFRYEDTGWPMGLSVAQSGAPTLDVEPYESLNAEPRYRSAQPRYGYLPLGNGDDARISYVVDELERPTWIVYLDRNNNEDLTDDGPPIQNEGSGRFAAAVSLPVTVTTGNGGTMDAPYKLWLWLNEYETTGGTGIAARFYARCHWVGRLDLGGRIYSAVAYEYDRHNGLYAENGLWIDLNEDGKLEADEHFHDGDDLRAGDRLYRLELLHP